MIQKILHNNLYLILVHIAFGFLATFPFFTKIYSSLVILIGAIIIYSNKNKNEEALLFASYIVGAEVFIRMTGGSFIHEIGKYGAVFFLILGLFVGKKKRVPVLYIFYIMLLLLGILLSKTPYTESLRKSIIFNLSGPIALGISAMYFYKRIITKQKLYQALNFMALPIFSMTMFLFIRTPNLNEIAFGGVANFYTSGGFGPNQVATILGLGVFILFVFQYLKISLTGFFFLDGFFLVYFIYRGLLTFSRGGMVTVLIAVFFFLFFMISYRSISINETLKQIGIGFLVLFGVWIYTSGVTGGMLNNRYTGKDALGRQKADITSGRTEIFAMQLESFYNSPLFGIGVGNGKYKRIESDKNVTAISHNEISRLLEEHGFIGIVILFILFSIPLAHIYQSNNYQRAFLTSFLIFWFLTIGHSAMRVAFPGFIYALSLINIVDKEDA